MRKTRGAQHPASHGSSEPQSPSLSMVLKAGVLVLILLTVLLSLQACRSQQQPLLIVTDLPEIVEYLEFIRARTDAMNFRIIFDEAADRNTALGGIQPDLIISSRIAHSEFEEYLYPIPMTRLEARKSFSDNFLLEDLYPGSYMALVENGSIKSLPLAFDLPLVHLSPDFGLPPDQITISYFRLMEQAAALNVRRSQSYIEMGFSALRSPDFIEILVREITGISGRIPDAEVLEAAILQIKELFSVYDQDVAAQIRFNELFAYSSDSSEMDAGRLHGVISSWNHYISQPHSRLAQYPLYWLTGDAGVQVHSPMLYAGILQSSGKKRSALEMLRRLLSTDTQLRYIEHMLQTGNASPSFLHRLSSNRTTNTRVLTLPGAPGGIRLPEESELSFPGKPDPLWEEVKQEVYLPWLALALTDDAESTGELAMRVDSYYRLNGGYR